MPPMVSYAQVLPNLPIAGVMVGVSPSVVPPMLKGITIHPEHPLKFDFIVHRGSSHLRGKDLKEESEKLIKYFLASLTIPEEELWVNLSPYEKDRIITESFGLTEMGRDLLAQDYFLKQLMASLTYPDKGLGKKFWERVYKRAYELYGTTQMPINTFNKVWILPEAAEVYEEGNTAYIVKSRLKVMLEEDYLALKKNERNKEIGTEGIEEEEVKGISKISSEIVREVLIPEIEKEVNEGKNFVLLRQIYQSLILATWYKQRFMVGTGRDLSLLGQIYVDKGKIKGVEVEDKEIKDKIYEEYLEGFKKGAYDFIKEDYDEEMGEVIARRYFSGGCGLNQIEEVFRLRGEIREEEREDGRKDFAMLVSVEADLRTDKEIDFSMLSQGSEESNEEVMYKDMVELLDLDREIQSKYFELNEAKKEFLDHVDIEGNKIERRVKELKSRREISASQKVIMTQLLNKCKDANKRLDGTGNNVEEIRERVKEINRLLESLSEITGRGKLEEKFVKKMQDKLEEIEGKEKEFENGYKEIEGKIKKKPEKYLELVEGKKGLGFYQNPVWRIDKRMMDLYRLAMGEQRYMRIVGVLEKIARAQEVESKELEWMLEQESRYPVMMDKVREISGHKGLWEEKIVKIIKRYQDRDEIVRGLTGIGRSVKLLRKIEGMGEVEEEEWEWIFREVGENNVLNEIMGITAYKGMWESIENIRASEEYKTDSEGLIRLLTEEREGIVGIFKKLGKGEVIEEKEWERMIEGMEKYPMGMHLMASLSGYRKQWERVLRKVEYIRYKGDEKGRESLVRMLSEAIERMEEKKVEERDEEGIEEIEERITRIGKVREAIRNKKWVKVASVAGIAAMSLFVVGAMVADGQEMIDKGAGVGAEGMGEIGGGNIWGTGYGLVDGAGELVSGHTIWGEMVAIGDIQGDMPAGAIDGAVLEITEEHQQEYERLSGSLTVDELKNELNNPDVKDVTLETAVLNADELIGDFRTTRDHFFVGLNDQSRLPTTAFELMTNKGNPLYVRARAVKFLLKEHPTVVMHMFHGLNQHDILFDVCKDILNEAFQWYQQGITIEGSIIRDIIQAMIRRVDKVEVKGQEDFQWITEFRQSTIRSQVHTIGWINELLVNTTEEEFFNKTKINELFVLLVSKILMGLTRNIESTNFEVLEEKGLKEDLLTTSNLILQSNVVPLKETLLSRGWFFSSLIGDNEVDIRLREEAVQLLLNNWDEIKRLHDDPLLFFSLFASMLFDPNISSSLKKAILEVDGGLFRSNTIRYLSEDGKELLSLKDEHGDFIVSDEYAYQFLTNQMELTDYNVEVWIIPLIESGRGEYIVRHSADKIRYNLIYSMVLHREGDPIIDNFLTQIISMDSQLDEYVSKIENIVNSQIESGLWSEYQRFTTFWPLDELKDELNAPDANEITLQAAIVYADELIERFMPSSYTYKETWDELFGELDDNLKIPTVAFGLMVNEENSLFIRARALRFLLEVHPTVLELLARRMGKPVALSDASKDIFTRALLQYREGEPIEHLQLPVLAQSMIYGIKRMPVEVQADTMQLVAELLQGIIQWEGLNEVTELLFMLEYNILIDIPRDPDYIGVEISKLDADAKETFLNTCVSVLNSDNVVLKEGLFLKVEMLIALINDGEIDVTIREKAAHVLLTNWDEILRINDFRNERTKFNLLRDILVAPGLSYSLRQEILSIDYSSILDKPNMSRYSPDQVSELLSLRDDPGDDQDQGDFILDIEAASNFFMDQLTMDYKADSWVLPLIKSGRGVEIFRRLTARMKYHTLYSVISFAESDPRIQDFFTQLNNADFSLIEDVKRIENILDRNSRKSLGDYVFHKTPDGRLTIRRNITDLEWVVLARLGFTQGYYERLADKVERQYFAEKVMNTALVIDRDYYDSAAGEDNSVYYVWVCEHFSIQMTLLGGYGKNPNPSKYFSPELAEVLGIPIYPLYTSGRKGAHLSSAVFIGEDIKDKTQREDLRNWAAFEPQTGKKGFYALAVPLDFNHTAEIRTDSQYLPVTSGDEAGPGTVIITLQPSVDSASLLSHPSRPKWYINDDDYVDIMDVLKFAEYLGKKEGDWQRADLNEDGVVDVLDLMILVQHFGESVAPAAPKILSLASELEKIFDQLDEGLKDAFKKGLVTQKDIDQIKNIIKDKIIITQKDDGAGVVTEPGLLQNFPNPVRGDGTSIPFQLAEDAQVRIYIHNVNGQLVRVLDLGSLMAGSYTTKRTAAHWDGRNNVGEQVANGVYFYTIKAGDFTKTKKMQVLRGYQLGMLDESKQEERSYDPKISSEAQNIFGLMLFEEGKIDKAAQHFRKAIELNPDNKDALNNLATAFDEQAEQIDRGEKGEVEASNVWAIETERVVSQTDKAMLLSDNNDVGGIDLNTANLDLQIKRDGNGVPFPVHLQDIKNINIEGLTPVIINIIPVTYQHLPFLLSEGEQPEAQLSYLSKTLNPNIKDRLSA